MSSAAKKAAAPRKRGAGAKSAAVGKVASKGARSIKKGAAPAKAPSRGSKAASSANRTRAASTTAPRRPRTPGTAKTATKTAAKTTTKTAAKTATKTTPKTAAKAATKTAAKTATKTTPKVTKKAVKAAVPSKKSAAVKTRPGGPYVDDDKFLAEQRQMLLAERAVYEAQASDLRAEADSLAQEREPGDVQFDEESGEGGTVTVDRERDLALSAQALAAVEEIDDALAKIANGTYGACEQCHQAIPKPRLRALPFARLCVACKSGGLSRR